MSRVRPYYTYFLCLHKFVIFKKKLLILTNLTVLNTFKVDFKHFMKYFKLKWCSHSLLGEYCMSKKSWPILCDNLLNKMGQDFLDTQYNEAGLWAGGEWYCCLLWCKIFASSRSIWPNKKVVAHFTMRTNDKSAWKLQWKDRKYIEEGDLSIEIANHSQRIFTSIHNNDFSIFSM